VNHVAFAVAVNFAWTEFEDSAEIVECGFE
jgi:hypothetical protein